MKANDLLSPETLLLCLSLLPAVSWMWFQWSHRRLLRVARSLPNVMGSSLPLLGDLHHTIHGTTKLAEVGFSAAVEAMKRGLKTFCFWCGPLPLILICDPGDVQKILNSSSTFEKADEMDYLKYALGDGLLTAPGHIWKVTRKHLNPLFHPRNLEHMVPVFNRSAREFLDTLAPHASRGPLDILEPFRDITLKTICLMLSAHHGLEAAPLSAVNLGSWSGFSQLLDTVVSATNTEDIFSFLGTVEGTAIGNTQTGKAVAAFILAATKVAGIASPDTTPCACDPFSGTLLDLVLSSRAALTGALFGAFLPEVFVEAAVLAGYQQCLLGPATFNNLSNLVQG